MPGLDKIVDYKKLIKSRENRNKIIRALNFVPDEMMVKIQYRIKTGRRLDLANPQRFTEKLQWYKLYYRDNLMKECADKYSVRQYVAKVIGPEYLIPLIAVYSSPYDVDFDSLPPRFVAKDSLGSGSNEVLICRDKSKLDSTKTITTFREWLSPGRHSKNPGREWVYENNGSSKIVIEEYMEDETHGLGLVDYKFFCFNGVAKYLYVIDDRTQGEGCRLGVFDAKTFEKIEAYRSDERKLLQHINKPANFDEMGKIAEKLAKPFPHVRVDLYDLGVTRGIRFGEMTFFDGSGYFLYEPDSFDYEAGSLFHLPSRS